MLQIMVVYKVPSVPLCSLTSHNELALVLHSSSLVASNAGVVAVVVRCEVVDSQRACKINIVDSHTQAGGDWPAIFLPRDVQRPVA